MSLTQDAEVEFTFIKAPNQPADSPVVDLSKHIEFFCQPALMKFSQGQQGFLNILAKVDSASISEEIKSARDLRRPINKLLIARVKDSNLLFSFFLSISLIDSSDAQGQS
jgi:hypothetical protein